MKIIYRNHEPTIPNQDPRDGMITHGDVFEDLIGKGEIEFNLDPTPENLDGWAGDCLFGIVGIISRCGKQVKMGNIGVKVSENHPAPPSLCFKVLNPTSYHYFDTYPIDETFMYVKDDGHHAGVHPDVVLAENLGLKDAKIIEHDDYGSVIESADIVIEDDRTSQSRIDEGRKRRKELWEDS